MANDRFMRKGITKMHFLTAVGTEAAATLAEIAAGTEITDQVAEVSGFSFSNSPISAPDMGSAFVAQISGEDTVEASSTTMYDLKDTTVLKDALAKGTVGFMAIYHSGYAGSSIASSDVYELWPVEIASNSRLYSAGNEAAQYMVGWTLTAPPVEGVTAA